MNRPEGVCDQVWAGFVAETEQYRTQAATEEAASVAEAPVTEIVRVPLVRVEPVPQQAETDVWQVRANLPA